MFKYLQILTSILAFSGLLTACSQDDMTEAVSPAKEIADNGFTTYIIAKNKHFTNNNIGELKSNNLKFIAKFDSSAIYKTLDKNNQADINKLYGFSDCESFHQTNSARFGWRWLNNQLEIFAYTYQNQVRQEKFIKAIDLNKEFSYELEALDNKYIFKLDGKIVEMPRGCAGNPNKYKLFPYFGGDEAAPHDIKIQIKEIE
jgi:hypothetical protein